MTHCIKTGAHVYLACYNEWLYGDAFKTTKGDIVMRVCERSKKPLGDVKHFMFLSYDIWFDMDKTSGDRNSTIIAEGFTEYGHKGVPV